MKHTGKMESTSIRIRRFSNAYRNFSALENMEDLKSNNLSVTDYYDIKSALEYLNHIDCEAQILHSKNAALWCKKQGLIIEELYGNFYTVSTTRTY